MNDAELKRTINIIRKKTEKVIFSYQESNILHPRAVVTEMLINAVKCSDTQKIYEMINKIPDRVSGTLSENEMRNTKNLAIITVSIVGTSILLDRFLYSEYCYSIADATIQFIEQAGDEEKIYYALLSGLLIMEDVINEQNEKEKMKYSIVEKTKDYIYRHRHEKICIEQIAQALSVSQKSISRKFKEQEGCTIQEFIINDRLSRAKNLLKYSDYTIQEIADYLGYSSQSHLGLCIKTETGMTPRQYRDYHCAEFRNSLISSNVSNE